MYGSLNSGSSRYIKHDIEELGDVGDVVDGLTPVSFRYNNDKHNEKRFGLIYEDTVDVLPEICHQVKDGRAIEYVGLIPVLLKEIKNLRSRVAALEEG